MGCGGSSRLQHCTPFVLQLPGTLYDRRLRRESARKRGVGYKARVSGIVRIHDHVCLICSSVLRPGISNLGDFRVGFLPLWRANHGGQVQLTAASNIYVNAFQGHLRNKLMHVVPGIASECRSNGEILRVLRLAKSLQGKRVPTFRDARFTRAIILQLV